MTDNKLDCMLKAYCDREAEAFEFKPKKRARIKAVSVIAAALVLTVFAALIIPSLSKGKHSFVLTVNAANTRLQDSQSGTVYTEYTVYDKNKNRLDHYSVMEAELLINGEDIEDVSFRSLNGYGRFFIWKNPDFDDYHDDVGWWCDSQGNPDPLYVGWRTAYESDSVDRVDYYCEAEVDRSNDWSSQYQYSISYNAVDDEDCFLQPEAATSSRDDVIEITVTFADGDTLTKRLSVTYPDGIMTVEEIAE